MPALELKGYGVLFGTRVVLADVSMTLPATGIDVLMGPVKTGKSTLMRSLSGLNDLNGLFRSWGEARVHGVPCEAAPRPLMVQQRAEVLNLSVQDAMVSLVRGHAERSVSAWAGFARDRIDECGPAELTHGLQQRLLDLPAWLQRCVSILAHALASPTCLFIDEPTFGLPADDAARMLAWLRRLGQRTKLLVVLHHQGEARALADRIVLLGGGRVIAHQATEDFFLRPAHPWVRHFLNSGSLPLPAPDAEPDQLEAPGERPPALPEQAHAALAEVRGQPAARPSGERSPRVVAGQAPARKPVRLPAPSAGGVEEASMVGRAILSSRRGPSGFHWIVPGRLAGCAEPGASLASADYDLDLLRGIGVTCLITLTESDLDQDLLWTYGLKNLHLPIIDREAPTLNQAYMLLKRMQDLLARGEVLAVHCKAGLGRTGTVLGAWLIREGGLSAGTAIDRLRCINRAFVQSEVQERFLERMEQDLLLRMD